jgi:hypothetical protein
MGRLSWSAAFLIVFLPCCGGPAGTGGSAGAGGSGSGGASGGSGSGGAQARYSLHMKIALTDDGKGVGILAQNGATVHVPASDIAGKKAWFATTDGGEPIGNATPIDFGFAVVTSGLTAEYHTPAHYTDGPWEMATFLSITGGDPMNGPQPGDLAGFDNSPVPAGQPPVTGVSVRMTVNGADASVTLGNGNFIQF